MTSIDIVDETFVVASVNNLRAMLCDERLWKPLQLMLDCFDDRGVLGKRWTLSGNLHGTAEVWLEPFADGVIVHFFLQADPVGRQPWRNQQRHYSRAVKAHILEVKRGYDLQRPAGAPLHQPEVARTSGRDKLGVRNATPQES